MQKYIERICEVSCKIIGGGAYKFKFVSDALCFAQVQKWRPVVLTTGFFYFPQIINPQNFYSMNYNVNENGFYGEFGGAFIPETLQRSIEELKNNYLKVISEKSFQDELKQLLRDYVGRPTPLYHAQHLSEAVGAKIYLKREDLCHTGAHKLNNAIGQILLAKRLGKKRVIAETGAGQHGVATAPS